MRPSDPPPTGTTDPAPGEGGRAPVRRRRGLAEGGAVRPQTTVLQGGRWKAYRPLPAGQRREAVARALAAYRRGDFFLAHELLEPAWMGTADPAERDLYQGLIKLCAGLVHALRGNPVGVSKNLRGARERLARGAPAAALVPGLDIPGLLRAIDAAILHVQRLDPRDDPAGHDSVDPAPRRRPLAIDPPVLPTATAIRRLTVGGGADRRADP